MPSRELLLQTCAQKAGGVNAWFSAISPLPRNLAETNSYRMRGYLAWPTCSTIPLTKTYLSKLSTNTFVMRLKLRQRVHGHFAEGTIEQLLGLFFLRFGTAVIMGRGPWSGRGRRCGGDFSQLGPPGRPTPGTLAWLRASGQVGCYCCCWRSQAGLFLWRGGSWHGGHRHRRSYATQLLSCVRKPRRERKRRHQEWGRSREATHKSIM